MYLDSLYCTNICALIIYYFFSLKTQLGDKMDKMIKADLLNKAVFGSYSWWPISHFYSHFVCTITGGNIVLILLISTLWELFENQIFVLNNVRDAGDNRKHRHLVKRDSQTDATYQYKTWWQGTFTDIWFNIAGVMCGLLCRHLITDKWYRISFIILNHVIVNIVCIILCIHTNVYPLINWIIYISCTFIYLSRNW